MEEKCYMVYKFEELSEDGKRQAIDILYDINIDHEWWDCTYEDAKNIGLEITEFDIDRANFLHGHISPEGIHTIVQRIISDHGKTCDTYKLAIDYYRRKHEKRPYDVDEFSYALREEYLSILKKEYEYLTSEEAIIETIKANDYDFTENGKID